MADYKQMYLTLLNSTEKAIEILIEAQRKCEEIYISTEQPISQHQIPEIIKWESENKTNPKL